jgi:hypothetical protein
MGSETFRRRLPPIAYCLPSPVFLKIMAIRNTPKNEIEMARFGKLADMDRSFDIEYWQRQTSKDRLLAVWEMVVSYHLGKGGTEDELRLQRTVEHFQRKKS